MENFFLGVLILFVFLHKKLIEKHKKKHQKIAIIITKQK